jgi:hypothetical protein
MSTAKVAPVSSGYSAAKRLRAKLPGGSGETPLIVAHAGGLRAPLHPPARRVSISELLSGALRYS